MSLNLALVIRPGALGDALLTLPALKALSLSSVQPAILGTPASWAFLGQDKMPVLDFSSGEWLWLFSGGKKPGTKTQDLLARCKAAIIYLREAEAAAGALRGAGLKTIICAEPPLLGDATLSPHAARQLLEPLRSWLPEETLRQAWKHCAENADVFGAVEELERERVLKKLEWAAPPPFLCALHPGSGGRNKCWPAKNFARLAAELSGRGFLPLVFFGPADGEVQKEFEAALKPGTLWRRIAQWPLREVFARLTLCRFYIGNDSGLSHLAARACPTLALFGPTAPSRWKPLGENIHVLQGPEGKLNQIEVEKVAACGLRIARK